MNRAALNEALSATQSVLTALLQTLGGQTGNAGAQLALVVGALDANAGVEFPGAQYWSDLANCFEQARLAGATFAAMDAVRATAEGFTPATTAGIAVKNFSVRMALAEEGQILAATTFTSRQQIDNYFDQINVSFATAICVAADNNDNVAYEALIVLQAAISNDLGTRARPLPQMTTYSFPTRMPSLWMAQRLYQDPTRAKQLAQENQVIHPAFMPASGIALSS